MGIRDRPKAYQISQFDIPLCENGYIDAIVDEEGHTKRIGVTRIPVSYTHLSSYP